MNLQFMESFITSIKSPSFAAIRLPIEYTCNCKRYNIRVSAAKLDGDNDPLFRAAAKSASLRYQETHRPEPLLVDPYAGCFVPPNTQMDMKQQRHHFCLATKFIDDKLLRTVNHMDGLKQVVLFSDGLDTRPYRLSWPASTIIFDISPERVFKSAAEKLAGVGAKIPRSCLFLHVPLESSIIQHSLRAKGFNANRPSVWAIQGLPLITLASFEEILSAISSLAVNGCFLIGELPAWLAEIEIGVKSSKKQWMGKIFMSNGFRVDMISYENVAKSLGKELASSRYKNTLFVAEQLRFSDDQMETWRRELQRVQDEGDEEGFEEL
ncbi:S-adenosyl-L-methionine-dependent methyltransferases superfamily protein [Quillaja saponaria]|uniref:S-adenosyl-L-methionine-dependent methyltransferases superfamily protein n=1 Tax=Quillaja saponaria TaxID=32244 RepID=A0AAD7Q9Y2_QUISA|nr:S-adenosyl-L-methionine-dependent methyltransferases superfamily protein [Quillaja saponaria]KAJ7977580.1 S-adenosyl-L-methionine-dependent methyltransferases superfamily protein [Quillaja saponaria]